MMREGRREGGIGERGGETNIDKGIEKTNINKEIEEIVTFCKLVSALSFKLLPHNENVLPCSSTKTQSISPTNMQIFF